MLSKKLKRLRDKSSLAQKASGVARITESAYCTYGLSDRNPKPEILDRVAKVLRKSSERLSALTFKNHREFAYAILKNEDAFGYDVRDVDAVSAIVKGYDSVTGFFNNLIRDWEQMRKKLGNHEITKEEYEDWKRTWDNGM